MKKIIIPIIFGSALIATGIYGVFIFTPSVTVVTGESASVTHDSDIKDPSQSNLVINTELSDQETFIQALSKQMKEQHAHEIQSVLVQLTMGDFKLFVMESFPDTGESVFSKIMNNAFPEYAQSIFNLLNSMNIYKDWHVDMLLALNDMDTLTRNGTLWNKRHELFGELAEEIWQKEIDSQQAKEKAIQETLMALHQADNMTMTDRLYTLTNSIQEQYGDEHSNFLISKGMVADIYFHLDSVQNDLKNMSNEDRALALSDSRKQLGFSDEAIAEMAEKDKSNESRWSNGYNYMAARDQYLKTYTGELLSEKLSELRTQYFKHEAATIEKEEAESFYRYERPRLYGSN